MHGLKLAGIELDRKVLAQMAYEDIEPSTSSPPSPRRPSRPNAPSNGMPLQGASRFPICARDPRAGSELSGKAKFELLLTLGSREVAERPGGSARGGGGAALPGRNRVCIPYR